MKLRLTLFFCFVLVLVQAQVKVQNLRCELLVNPIGIDVKTPRLSWEITASKRGTLQQSYQILVASSLAKLNNNEADLWNSGTIHSSASIHITYNGKPLTSRSQAFWKVKSITNNGSSEWSKSAQFSVGLLNKTDWKGKWIGYDMASQWDSVSKFSRLSARYFRKQFDSKPAVKRATVYIVGLGMYELYLNGHLIGDQVLAPAPTDYRKTVLYNTHDVTKWIKQGSNAIATVLGNGRFFTMRQDYKPLKINTFGFPKMLLQLEIEYTDGSSKTIVSDDTWKLNVDGPIRSNNEYDGEEYDATKEQKGWNEAGFNDHSWVNPQLVMAPQGEIVAQMNEPMKVVQTIRPISIQKLETNKYILDFGQNFSGWVQIKGQGSRNTKTTLRFAESLQKNGQLYVANLRDALVTDAYTFKGEGIETWHPVFVYHGFRYVEVNNYPGTPSLDNFEGQLVYDNLATIGSFHSSNETLNKIYHNAWWGIASNYKGMPIDCPQRNERQPWLGDRLTGAYGESFLFANQNLYAKWLDDIESAQTVEGSIPDVAPAFWNYYSDNITWPGTYIFVADMLYKQYGDIASIKKHYPSMKLWMEYMREKFMKNDLISKDKYGDWCVPPESLELIHAKDSLLNTRGDLIATAYYYQLLGIMENFQTIIGAKEDVESYDLYMENIKKAFQKAFYNSQKKCYDNNSITSNLLPLAFGITPDSLKEAVFNNIYNKIKIDNHMHISTGVIGTQWLMRTLTQFQRSDIAYTIASNKTYPSWGYMTENNATTIWELWNGNTANPQMNSQNHVMLLGDLLIWMNENLGGIKTDNKEVAFKKIIMKPEMVDGLNNISVTYQSLYGIIKSNWTKTLESFKWNITIPANTTATIYIPGTSDSAVSESGIKANKSVGVTFIKMDGQFAVYEIGSGDYHFESIFPFRKGVVKDEFIFTQTSFPESHAATIAETPNGLIAAWFGGTKEGNKDVCIWTSQNVNGHWTNPIKVADGKINDTTVYACYNPVLYQVPNGELILFYKIGPNVAGWKGFLIRSFDNGKTWSSREALPEGFLGPIKNKPEIVNGVLVCPSSTEKTGWKVHFEYTSDNGKTWTKSEDLNDGKTMTGIQPTILKYKDGSLQTLTRTKQRVVNEAWSKDGGKTWSPLQSIGLPNNNSGLDGVTLQDGRQLLVYNHVKPAANATSGKGARSPLNVAVSSNGKDWFAAAILETSPINQYSYPSVIQTKDGLVHIVYTWRRERIKHVVLDPTKLILQPITNEQWPGAILGTSNTNTEE
jgi:alpha-L-rhamnosidase